MAQFTYEGKKYTIDDKALNDLETVELIADIADDEKPYLITKLAKKIFGNDQYTKIKDNLRDDDGYVPTERFGEFMEAALKTQAVKN